MFRYSKLSGIAKFQEFALMTLKKMAKGGIFDQIGIGLIRIMEGGHFASDIVMAAMILYVSYFFQIKYYFKTE